MTIERDPPFYFDVYCDAKGCNAEERIDTENFYTVIDRIKEMGWRVFRLKGEWIHHCPACNENEFEDD